MAKFKVNTTQKQKYWLIVEQGLCKPSKEQLLEISMKQEGKSGK